MKAGGFAALYLLSPQVFYAYYRLIIPGLPNQWVIRWPEADHILRGLLFEANGRLAEHVAGALFWGLILQAIWLQTATGRTRGAAAVAVVSAIGAARLVF